ncbi:MAG: dihydropteroate synthase [Nitrospirae bacterium]|nr:dihydropteroate synthase [Nitrospirota bacterium]
MGILNVTPDSFSDGGRFVVGGGRVDGFSRVDVAAAVEAALLMAEAGADIIDVGGESTRPGSDRVSPDEEQARVVPVIEGIRKRSGIPISIDTYKAATALAAVRAGADIINDISGLAFDPDMPKAAADSGAALVVMHIKGTPEDMQKDPNYDDLMGEVTGFLMAGSDKALRAGVPRDRILVDPGIGFGKTLAHNLELINRLDELSRLGYPVVLGVSRKAFIGRLTGADDPMDRGDGSVAAAVMGIARGAHIIRAHDVRSAKRAALVADAIMRAGRS